MQIASYKCGWGWPCRANMGGMDPSTRAQLNYELLLHSRQASQGVAPYHREFILERSATVLLTRLVLSGPMTIAELADAFGLDVSTVHRQVTSARKNGLVETIRDPGGGQARRHQPTKLGRQRLEEEFAGRQRNVDSITMQWSDADIAEFERLLRRYNEDFEKLQGTPWPRPDFEGRSWTTDAGK